MLAQANADAVVIGVGLNVSTTRDELALPVATSLLLEQADDVDRASVLGAVLEAFMRRYDVWAACDGDAERCGLAADYTQRCSTLGRAVTVTTAQGQVRGHALKVDAEGRLVIARADDEITIAAGDVQHVRPTTRDE